MEYIVKQFQEMLGKNQKGANGSLQEHTGKELYETKSELCVFLLPQS